MPAPGTYGQHRHHNFASAGGVFAPRGAFSPPFVRPLVASFQARGTTSLRVPGARVARGQSCRECGLALGETAYRDGSGQATLHGECAALRAMREVQVKEEARMRTVEAKKKKTRQEYDIGWKVERVPRNSGLAGKLNLEFLSKQGLCSLAFNEEARSVRVVECTEPAAGVNLEYLSLALQVRLHAGREPVFSLDPLDKKKDPNKSKQAKRFEPEWLMGTSLGEVMFQADYHLKELAMGEYEQPVVGMKSAFDFTEAEGVDEAWNARAWFVVSNAEVFMTEGDVLVPRIGMGVEAREQEVTEHGSTDVPTTRPDHPMVKFAEAFTHNFDLIAERKSVVFHLREAAKASILAKFLLEAQVELDESWFNLVDWFAVKEAVAGCCLEIPQLWKDRTHSEVRLKGGQVVGARRDVEASTVSLYGGVEFGLGRFAVPPGRRAPPSMLTPGAGLMARTLAPTRVPIRPQGVDFNLDKFDLSAPTRLAAGGAPHGGLSSGAFWSLLESKEATASGDADAALLREVFNPNLCDRRDDGDRFLCPDLSASYLERLRALVKEEAEVRQKRTEHFLGAGFAVGDAGPLFPSSWSFSVEVAQALDLQRRPCPPDRVDPKDLRRAAVAFDKSTEDGLRFRVYCHGGLEVRTTQAHGCKELVGSAFCFEGSRQEYCVATKKGDIKGDEKVVRVKVASIGSAARKATPEATQVERKVASASERKSRLANLIYSSGEMRKDREVVLAAVEQDGLTLKRAAEELKGDREIVQLAVQDKGGALEFASEALRADRELVLSAIEQDACALEHASDELRSDKQVAAKAVKVNSFALRSVAPGLRSDRELILASLQRNAFALEHASEELLADRDFLLAAVRKNAYVLEDVPRKLRADKDFMLEVVRGNGFALKYASAELRADGEVILAAMEQDSRAVEYADRAALEAYLARREEAEAAAEEEQADGRPGAEAAEADEGSHWPEGLEGSCEQEASAVAVA